MRTEQRKEFTATWLDAVDPAPAGKRVVWWDVREPGLGVRVTDKGVVSFFVLKRIAGSKTPTRITLGRYPTLGLADARRAAAGKLEVIERGKGPARGGGPPAGRGTGTAGRHIRGTGRALQDRASGRPASR